MATMANPMSMVSPAPGTGQTVPLTGGAGSQNMNPLGTNVFSTLNQTSPVSATLPITVPQGIYGTGTNLGKGSTPSTAGGFNPATGAGMGTPTSGSGLDFTAMGDLQAIYGRGTGTAVGNILGSLGTSTSQAEQLMLQPTMQAANQMQANLMASQAARGVSPDSSTAALESSNLAAGVSGQIAGEMGQIGLSEEAMLLNALTGAGQQHGGDVSGWDVFGSVMKGIGGAGLQLGTAALSGGLPLSSMLGL